MVRAQLRAWQTTTDVGRAPGPGLAASRGLDVCRRILTLNPTYANGDAGVCFPTEGDTPVGLGRVTDPQDLPPPKW